MVNVTKTHQNLLLNWELTYDTNEHLHFNWRWNVTACVIVPSNSISQQVQLD